MEENVNGMFEQKNDLAQVTENRSKPIEKAKLQRSFTEHGLKLGISCAVDYTAKCYD